MTRTHLGSDRSDSSHSRTPVDPDRPRAAGEAGAQPACPVCGGVLLERRGKLICSRCQTICETCCEGGRG